ncbi:MAG: hypothetical protein RI907_1553 [Pseudomonadota bacterium]|jgi:prolyl 4-hydroxylase
MALADSSSLQGWLALELSRGCSPGSLVKAMLDSGWSLDDATAALLLAAARAEDVAAMSASPTPRAGGAHGPDLSGAEGNVVRAGDRDVRVLLTLHQPRVVVVADLLSGDECEALITQAEGRLKRSQTVSSQEASTAEVNVARTSEGMFFEPAETELVARLEARIAALVQWPVDHAEGLQLLRYGPGAEYRPHFDHFDAATPGGHVALQRGGQRVGTVVVYLRAPAEGGATVFPDVGLSVRPQAGHAVFFAYPQAHGKHGVLHGGAPVTAGEKWIATRWLRQKKFV